MIYKMQLYTTSSCQLKCEFCPRSLDSYEAPKIYLPMDDFKKYADICIEYGITEFELSPLVGEALFDEHIFERVEYLNSKASVKTIFFFTNMLRFTPALLEKSKQYEKFAFKLSLYGSNREQYKQRTGVDAFEKMLSSMQLIWNYKPRIIEIDIRYDASKNIKQDTRYFVVSNAIFSHYKNEVYCQEDVNWNNELVNVTTTLEDPPVDRSHEIKKGSSCAFLDFDLGIWPNGDLGVCSCWFDLNKKMILGNLNSDNIKSLLEKVDILRNEQRNGLYRSLCSVCTYPLRNL